MFRDVLNAAKRVTNQTGFVRQSISKLSKSEKKEGVSPEARRQIAQTFTENVKQGRRTVEQAERDADGIIIQRNRGLIIGRTI